MDSSAPSIRSVLLLAGDTALQTTVTRSFEGHGLTVVSCADSHDARRLLREHYFNAFVLDLDLPAEDCFSLVREFGDSWAPALIVVSARPDDVDRIMILELGADDYLTKPFNPRELLARVNAVCRRSVDRRTQRRRRAQIGKWQIDFAAHRISDSSDQAVELTSGEMTLLRVFVDHPNRALPRQEILALTRRDDAEVFDRTIDVLVSRLRAKIEDDPRHPMLIQTVRGAGYRFDAAISWLS